MLVFDVGANNGDKAAAMRGTGARLVCFEPQPHCAAKLRQRFSGDASVAIEECALGRAPGAARMSICDAADTISTLSDEWKTGRFRDFRWDREVEVRIDTLDAAIARHGVPDYVKVDVEGFEVEVLHGLSRPLPLLSFEFTREFEARAVECVRRLQSIGFGAFNISYGETHRFAVDEWVDAEGLVAALPRGRHKLAWGDIHAAQVAPPPELLRLVTRDHEGAEDTLAALRRAGLSFPGVPLRLHLGCGQQILDDYVNIDHPSDRHNVMQVRPDHEADITALAFPDGSVDEVRLHHVFEHFNRVVALGMLVRWHGWLREGGTLLIEAPDFLATAGAALAESGARRVALIRHLEGDQAADWAYHVGQWYPERFERTLAALGFGEVTTACASTAQWHDPPLHNVTARAVKTASLPRAELVARAEALLLESTVAAAERPTWEVWRGQLRSFLAFEPPPAPPVAHAPLAKPGLVRRVLGALVRRG